ncbi:MAG: hypothetical protein ACYDCL_04620 [Myxococcales bacterium]
MPLPLKMVVGFNNNIKYKGRVYHVQTEDSGVDNPHVITHLFVGGNILSSKKSSYTQLVGSPELERSVRELMQRQHKEMLKSLVSGQLDHLDVEAAARSFQPGELAESPAASRAPPGLPPPQEIEIDVVETLFADDLISEKSLDEVILSYLTDQIGK